MEMKGGEQEKIPSKYGIGGGETESNKVIVKIF